MAFVPVDNTAMVEVRMMMDSQKIENTLYFHRGDTISESELTTLGAAVIDWWDELYGPFVSDAVALREVAVTDLTTADSLQVIVPAIGTHVGGQEGAVMPNETAFCISFYTAQRGRSGRGRNYVSGIRKEDTAGNLLSSTIADGLRLAYIGVLDVAGDNGWSWVVVSRRQDNADLETGFSYPVTSVNYKDLVLDSMRSRKPGNGT